MPKTISLKIDEKYDVSELLSMLVDLGYTEGESDLVSGQYRRNGGVIQLYPVNVEKPVMLDFFGNILERIVPSNSSDKMYDIVIHSNILELADQVTIHPADYVVHEDHGIGQFSHLELKKIEGDLILYAVINYLNNDLLRVPEGQFTKITKYVGVGRRKPKLNKLGTETWKKTYKKTYDDVIRMARELLNIYAKREISRRKPQNIYIDWDAELVKTFGFTETVDQKTAIEAVYKDLADPSPMDRLVCGDVGFGKTEVALRAAAQVVANGYQAVFLVPTTILAEQHFSTFTKRFANLPVRIERLSRFVDPKDAKEIVENTEKGSIDILIGTHKLLHENINFRNLGLLVIDEEQKFGVKDKEKLKNFKENIDALTLTATPIPRTLFMALSGIRDLSLISSVPEGRHPIATSVTKYDESLVYEAIEREIARGGQVYYLHNKVSTIGSIRARLSKQFPDLRVLVAHGQMGEITLAETMREFSDGKIDILVCSTIIENGLDLPNVNTLIVDEADRFGLSQLYQIRGRIGRSKKKSYSLFTYSAKTVSSNAIKRLKILAENTELGTGYNIAVSDLEIRGGGNILGRDQHGNMEAVGLILYSNLLNTAVKRLKAGKPFNVSEIGV